MAKKIIKIDFRYYWGHFNPEDNIIINLLKKDYNVIIDKDNPDYVFYSTYDKKRPINSKTFGRIGIFIERNFPNLYRVLRDVYYFRRERWKMPVIEGDFVKIFFTVENAIPNMNKCDWAFTNEFDEILKHPRHLRISNYTFYSVKDPKALIKDKNYNPEKILKEKKKFCVFICSNDVAFRNKFFKALCKYKKVESWGKVLNNMGKGIPKVYEIEGKKSKKETRRYIPEGFLKQYKFIIAFENASHRGYTSDRKIEPMMANCIPIYWGNPLVHWEFNTKSFVNYHEFEKEIKKNIPKIIFDIPLIGWFTKKRVEKKTLKKVIQRIKNLDKNEELYLEMLKEPWYIDNKPSKYLDKDLIRKRLKKIIDSPKQIS
ncbi:MAG: glycosyltransferase family 10 [archaeon]